MISSADIPVTDSTAIEASSYRLAVYGAPKRGGRWPIGGVANCAESPSKADSRGAYCRERPEKQAACRIQQLKISGCHAAPAADALLSPVSNREFLTAAVPRRSRVSEGGYLENVG
jgi:hypothetical protein